MNKFIPKSQACDFIQAFIKHWPSKKVTQILQSDLKKNIEFQAKISTQWNSIHPPHSEIMAQDKKESKIKNINYLLCITNFAKTS